MVYVHVLYGSKIHAALGALVLPVRRIVQERMFVAVEDEPPLAPRLDAATHLDQVAPAGRPCEGNVGANIHIVASGLCVTLQVKFFIRVW